MDSTLSLLSLPAEIRSKIWDYCRPDSEALSICPCAAQPCRHTFNAMTSTATLHKSCEPESLVYTTDLNLIFINKQISNESRHLFSGYTLKFCSRPCLVAFFEILGNNRRDWINTIEITIDLRPLKVGFCYSSLMYIDLLRKEKELIRDIGRQYFATSQFEGVEVWNGFDIVWATRHDYVVTGKLA